MAFSKNDALDAVREVLKARASEAPRLERIARALRAPAFSQKSIDGSTLAFDLAMQPASVPVEIPKDAPDVMRRLALKSETNYLPLIVDTFSQGMKVDGYYTAGKNQQVSMWGHWQRNRMDAQQTGIHRSAVTYGASYTTILPGDRGPVIKGYSPRRMTAVYADPASDEWPILALDVDGSMLRLFDEERVYYIGAENAPRGLFDPLAPNFAHADLQFIESRTHDVGVTPVVRFRDRMLLDGEEQFGLVEPLMSVQQRINETTFGLMVAQFWSAFKQRYVIGWVPHDEAEEMRANASDVWYFDDPDVKAGQFDQTDLKQYIDAKASALRDLSAIGQVSAQNFGLDGISNISQETVAALDSGKERKSDEITTSLGESWEQALRTCAFIAGDETGAEDYTSQVRWKDQTARSFAQTVDGLGKLATMLQLPVEILWEKIPGWTDTDVDRAKALRRGQPTPAQVLQDVISKQTNAAVSDG